MAYSWKWSYFKVKNLNSLKCNICKIVVRPRIINLQTLINHLNECDEVCDELNLKRALNWNKYFNLVDHTKKYIVKCKYCKVLIKIKRITVSEEMTAHLSSHNININEHDKIIN